MDLLAQLSSYGPIGIAFAILGLVVRAQYQENRAKDAKMLADAEAAGKRETEATKAAADLARAFGDLTAAVGRAEATQTQNANRLVEAFNRRQSSSQNKAVIV